MFAVLSWHAVLGLCEADLRSKADRRGRKRTFLVAMIPLVLDISVGAAHFYIYFFLIRFKFCINRLIYKKI